MTHDELAALLDAKLEPLRLKLEGVEVRLFGNGQKGICDRITKIETTCEERAKQSEKQSGRRWDLFLAMCGWAVTLIVLVFKVWR